MTVGRPERGAVLPLVLLLMMAMTLVAHASLYLAQRELEVARASLRDLRGRLAAEGAIRGILASWPRDEAAVLGTGESLTAGEIELDRGVSGLVTIRRLGRELYLVEAEGRQEGWPGVARALRLVWVVEPAAVLDGFGAVVQVGGEVRLDPGTGVDATAPLESPEGWEGVCEPLSEELGALFPGGTLPALETVAVEPSGIPGHGDPLLGPLTAADLVLLARRTPTGFVTPSPSVRGDACAVEDPANWGAPEDPEGTCGDFLPLVAAPDSVVVRGGGGQGVLAVAGSLRLAAGARFWGPVLVAGDLTLEADARIYGLVRVLGSLELLDGARIVGSGCPALRSLQESSGLQRPAPLSRRSWISPY